MVLPKTKTFGNQRTRNLTQLNLEKSWDEYSQAHSAYLLKLLVGSDEDIVKRETEEKDNMLLEHFDFCGQSEEAQEALDGEEVGPDPEEENRKQRNRLLTNGTINHERRIFA